MAAGKFVIKKGRSGQFRFSLVGHNGQIVATGETYTTKASCMDGIKAVRTLAADARSSTRPRSGPHNTRWRTTGYAPVSPH